MNRTPLFDKFRAILKRGFTPDEVAAIDAAIDGMIAGDVAQPKDEDWQALAVPLIERFEGYARALPSGSVQAYPDPATGGKPWTIGIGSTTDEQGNSVKQGDVWTRERAVARFKAHLAEFAEGVDRALAGKPTTPAQKAAMVSLAYNVGVGAFAGSTLLKKHLAGDYAGAADQFLVWNRAGGKVMAGLTRRREAERTLYRSGT